MRGFAKTAPHGDLDVRNGHLDLLPELVGPLVLTERRGEGKAGRDVNVQRGHFLQAEALATEDVLAKVGAGFRCTAKGDNEVGERSRWSDRGTGLVAGSRSRRRGEHGDERSHGAKSFASRMGSEKALDDRQGQERCGPESDHGRVGVGVVG